MDDPDAAEGRRDPPARTAPAAAFVARGAGAAARASLFPLKVAGKTPGVGRAVVRGGAQLGSRGVERAVDRAMAGPLPETVAGAMVEQRVIQRVAAEVLAGVDIEAAVAAALERERSERLFEQVLDSDALERIISDAVGSRLAEDLVARLAASDELQHLVEEVVASDAVRTAIARQTAGFGAEVASELRTRTRRVDDAATARAHGADRSPAGTSPYAGLLARAVGGAVDLAIVSVVFLGGGAMIGLLAQLVGGLRPEWLAAALAAIGWTLVVSGYLLLFWTIFGQTPGMRVMGLHVTTADGRYPGAARALVRLVGLVVSIIPMFLGFLPVLFDSRRRGLADMLAGTVVVADDRATTPAGGG